jgi:hypothetical protein
MEYEKKGMKIKNKEFREYFQAEISDVLATIDDIEKLEITCFRRELCSLLHIYELRLKQVRNVRHKKQIIETKAIEDIIQIIKSYFR